jgi:hypothetical protein
VTTQNLVDGAPQPDQSGAVTIRYFDLDGGFGNANSSSADQYSRDGSHGEPHEHHYEKEGGMQVSSVPLPAGLWLFGSGLIALFGAAGLSKTQP